MSWLVEVPERRKKAAQKARYAALFQMCHCEEAPATARELNQQSVRRQTRRRAETAGAASLYAGDVPKKEQQVATMAAVIMRTTTAMPALSAGSQIFATALARRQRRPGRSILNK